MSRWVSASMLVLVLLLSGCTTPTTEAEFIRYVTLPDGTRAAIVSEHPALGEQTAYSALTDLEPGEKVLVRQVGGADWDMPRWTPNAEVVSRADD
jgi:hypothetical protein